jgi:hypothetical protein
MQVTDTDVRLTSDTGTGRTIASAKSGYQEIGVRSLLRRRQGSGVRLFVGQSPAPPWQCATLAPFYSQMHALAPT